ncbi:MAG: hypothetical protein ACPGPC_15755 [Alphaproteobacteria bacterium]
MDLGVNFFDTVRAYGTESILDPITAKRYAGPELVVRPFVPSITQKIALVLPRDRLRSVILEEFIAVLRSALAVA